MPFEDFKLMGRFFFLIDIFTAALILALSVVSIELFSFHKMADIRFRVRQRGGPKSENRRNIYFHQNHS